MSATSASTVRGAAFVSAASAAAIGGSHLNARNISPAAHLQSRRDDRPLINTVASARCNPATIPLSRFNGLPPHNLVFISASSDFRIGKERLRPHVATEDTRKSCLAQDQEIREGARAWSAVREKKCQV